MAPVNKYTKEVENTLKQASINHDKEKALKLQRYLGTKLHVYGLESKAQTEICKQGFSFYSDDKQKTFIELNSVFLGSKSHEGKNQALIYLDRNYKHISLEIQYEILPTWIYEVDNWAHSDYLSKFLTRLLENDQTKKSMLSKIKTWNNDSNEWIRRQSLVSLHYYARTKKNHTDFNTTKQLVLNLINDEHYFVQKAVGWTLRESYNIYPKETYTLVKQNIKHISPTAFTTCLEKMSESEKTSLKLLRK